MKRIAVVGTGYVGLVTGTCFADKGNSVICVDIDAEKVQKMKDGIIPIYEPGLETVFQRNIDANRISFTTDLKEAVDASEIIFLALPTPPGGNGEADLSYVLETADVLGEIITEYKVIVDKSTVPVGTAEKVTKAISAKTDVPFAVVSNPEFLREGFALQDFMEPDRVVIGTEDPKAVQLMRELYEPFIDREEQFIAMDEKSAELTKYAANSFLATKITFMNEIANYCEIVGANVDMVRKGIGSDDRIGSKFLRSGIGFGGSCFPKDVQALVRSGKNDGYPFQIVESVMNVNKSQRIKLVDKVVDYFADLKGVRLAMWGLAFKPNTDDIREAASLYMIDELTRLGATIVAYDPEAIDNVKNQIGDKIEYADSAEKALEGCDALMLVTEWKEFVNSDLQTIYNTLNAPVVFDGRNVFELDKMSQLNFYYSSIGRKTVIPKK